MIEKMLERIGKKQMEGKGERERVRVYFKSVVSVLRASPEMMMRERRRRN